MMEAAVEAARFERAISVADVEPTTARAIEDGIKVVNLSAEDELVFRKIADDMFDQYNNYFSPGLLTNIKLS